MFLFDFHFNLQVTVEDLQSGEIGTFSCQRWLSTSDGDGLITRELVRDDENTRGNEFLKLLESLSMEHGIAKCRLKIFAGACQNFIHIVIISFFPRWANFASTHS